MTEPLYRRVLGAGFDGCRAPCASCTTSRASPSGMGARTWSAAARSPRRIAAALTSLPPEGDDQPLRVTFHAIGEREIWGRQFGSALFRSVQYESGGLLHERVGPTTFVFTPLASAEGLALRLDGFRVLGVPLPRASAPGRAHLRARAGRPLPLRGRGAPAAVRPVDPLRRLARARRNYAERHVDAARGLSSARGRPIAVIPALVTGIQPSIGARAGREMDPGDKHRDDKTLRTGW